MAIGLASYAQTTSDGYQYARTQNFGSARFQALGGAFGALGGDLSAVSANPASSAVFSTSFGSLTVGSNNKDFSSSYFGTTTDTQRNNLVFDQIGAVLVMKPSYNNTKIEKIAIAINYQQEVDYRNRLTLNGTTNNSIANFFAGQANGIDANILTRQELSDGQLESDGFVYDDLGFNNALGRPAQQAYLGFQTLLIDPIENDNARYVSGVVPNTSTQNTTIVSSGHKSKFSLNASAKYTSGLHLGANLNIHSMEQRRNILYSELNNFANIGYEINEDLFGIGISVGAGAIFTSDNWRAGLSYQTPTWYNMTRSIDEFINVSYNEDVTIDGRPVTGIDIDPSPEIFFEYPEYSFRTPGKLSGSLAYVIGKKGLITAQYDRQDFSKTRYGSTFTGSNILNQNIKNTFQAVNTFRIGAEARAEQWRFRAGANLSTSPYKDDTVDGETKGYSLGIGYDWGKLKIDAAYVNTTSNYNETPFENNNFSNSGNVDLTRDQISVTLGVNF